MIKAVIFDLDGVIVSTDEYHAQSWSFMTKQENIIFDETLNNQLRGVSRLASLNVILKQAEKSYSEEEKVILTNIKNDYYVSLLSSLNQEHICPGVLVTIEELKKKGIKIGIGSSSKNAKLILKKIGLSKTFDAIADGNDVEKSKPHPDIFLLAATKLGISFDQCLVVEDAKAGVVAAKRAGMLVLALKEAKKEQEADFKADNISELLDIIKKINIRKV